MRLLISIMVIFCLAGFLSAEEIHHYTIGLEYGLSVPTGGKPLINDSIPYKFTGHGTFGLRLGTILNKRWVTELNLGFFKIYDDR